MVGVNFNEKTYSIGFAFLESGKEENVTRALKVCQSMLKDQEEMPKVIVIGHNTVLMNSVANVFPTSYALLCRYPITKNVRSQVKSAIGAKQINVEDGKMVKEDVVVEKIMDACNHIVNSSTKELYADSVMHFRKMCEKYPDLLKYVESIILDQVNKKVVCAWTDQLVGNISRASLNYIFHKVKRADNVGSDSAKCGYCLSENDRLETTFSKDAPKKLKPTPSDTSTVRSPLYFEHVDNVFSNSTTPKSQKSVFKGDRISKPPPSPPQPNIQFIDEVPLFMHKYIEQTVNIERDDNRDYRAISALLSKEEDNHTLVHHQLIQELKTHKESYTRLYKKKENFDEIYESLVLCLSGPTLEEK
ncbi:uncharacterized protein LOC127113951 [Lathyrus oleraceus]|uniref:uncharacterized protein LOC127113951 n=1 Tax=Pisum sativum TaxID=3888 RepID=UPI0021D2E1EB|nr:uncharacterized protein LOC127113951 [Pisum sativum]